VKASTETDADAADRSSDSIRVDASELRAKVVGEGGNLGMTRRARVEYAAHGGRINADFIDNSGGVDCSDHEVNLKILLGLAEQRGELTRAERDELLLRGHRGRRAARPLRLLPAGADHRPGGRPLGLAAVRLRGPDGRCWRRPRSSTARRRTCRRARRSASAGAPAAAWSARSWRSSSPTPSGCWRAR
jgi:hypothetical protein